MQPGGNKPHGGATDVIRLRADLKSRLFVIEASEVDRRFRN